MDPDDVAALRAEVERRFVVTGAATPGWPDPRADRGWGEGPPDDWYSRCLDPAKYLIQRSRVQAWTDTLLDRGLATEESVDVATLPVPAERRPDRATRLRPTAAGALPIVVTYRAMDDIDDVVVCLGVGDPPVDLVSVLPCGCDACDDGSAPVLGEIDERFVHVLTGDFVHLALPGGATLVTSGDGGWSGSGSAPWDDGPTIPDVLPDGPDSAVASPTVVSFDSTDASGDLRAEVVAERAGQPDVIAIADARAGRSPYPTVHGAPWA